MKAMKDMTKAAPSMIANAKAMGAQAQEMAAAQQAAAQAQMQQFAAQQQAVAAAGGADYEPIAGVSLDAYAEISKELANHNYDQSQAATIASGKGISASSWEQAVDGWNQRIRSNPTVAQRFNQLYTGR
jgi:thiamine monophosphate kinase